jgi:glycosyltransferase involved in cell wall biosynthesis
VGKTGWPWTTDSPRCENPHSDGQTWPRVSIVTPSYNQGRFLEETIRSVLLQGYPDLEYLIIDGGSRDESLDIIRKYGPWLAYWTSKPDRGQAHAINEGWLRATGNIVAYINSDDYYSIGAVARAAGVLRATPGAGMFYGTALIVSELGHPLREWKARPFDLNLMLSSGNVVPQPATFFSKKALEAVGFLDENLHQILDYELCIRLGVRFPSVCAEDTLAIFRNHQESKTRARFEHTALELLEFLKGFTYSAVGARELRRIKRAGLSRVYYELALAYVAPGQCNAGKALRSLARSVGVEPSFALRQPLLTAHIGKRALVGYIASTIA